MSAVGKSEPLVAPFRQSRSLSCCALMPTGVVFDSLPRISLQLISAPRSFRGHGDHGAGEDQYLLSRTTSLIRKRVNEQRDYFNETDITE